MNILITQIYVLSIGDQNENFISGPASSVGQLNENAMIKGGAEEGVITDGAMLFFCVEFLFACLQ